MWPITRTIYVIIQQGVGVGVPGHGGRGWSLCGGNIWSILGHGCVNRGQVLGYAGRGCISYHNNGGGWLPSHDKAGRTLGYVRGECVSNCGNRGRMLNCGKRGQALSCNNKVVHPKTWAFRLSTAPINQTPTDTRNSFIITDIGALYFNIINIKHKNISKYTDVLFLCDSLYTLIIFLLVLLTLRDQVMII